MSTRREAEELKAKGNIRYQAGNYIGAESYYTEAIIRDSSNPAYFTNRALARLKLNLWESVISDCQHALELNPASLKAYTYLGQAQLALNRPNEALSSSQQAYKLAIAQRSPSAATIAQIVLDAKKMRWQVAEERRILEEDGLLKRMVALLEEEGEREVQAVKKEWEGLGVDIPNSNPNSHGIQGSFENLDSRFPFTDDALRGEIEVRHHAVQEQINQLKAVFARSDPQKYKPRVVPDYFIDNITFCVMHDPVITKHGHSYERATILEHLRRSETDPLTREPLTEDDLRPNLGLKMACEEYLKDNGWAVDY